MIKILLRLQKKIESLRIQMKDKPKPVYIEKKLTADPTVTVRIKEVNSSEKDFLDGLKYYYGTDGCVNYSIAWDKFNASASASSYPSAKLYDW